MMIQAMIFLRLGYGSCTAVGRDLHSIMSCIQVSLMAGHSRVSLVLAWAIVLRRFPKIDRAPAAVNGTITYFLFSLL